MNDAILVINAGSSSIKFAVYAHTVAVNESSRLFSGSVAGIGMEAACTFTMSKEGQVVSHKTIDHSVTANNHSGALQFILDWIEQDTGGLQLVAAGHRVVHGGTAYSQAVRVDAEVFEQLQVLIALAPLHQPHALHAIEALQTHRPQLPQVACFDTAFHAGMPAREQYFALPRSLVQQGIRRYGFHGLSYEYIVSVLPMHLGAMANGKVVIAHLGQGVSLCAVDQGRSIATSMSFTPLDGLPMGTRSGSIDPAVVLYLLENGMSSREISDLLHHQSGLLGLSGISGDIRILLDSDQPAAAEAVEVFCYRISRELGSLAAALGGIDAVIFTGGIGEHAAPVREKICQASAWLGLEIDSGANQGNTVRISTATSKVSVWVIPTDEEQVIARHTAAVIFGV